MLISKIYFKVYTYLHYFSSLFHDLLIRFLTLELCSIQLLFSHYVKYAEIWAFFVSVFLRIISYLYSVQLRENKDMILSIYGKIQIRERPVFWHISRSVLLNIISHNLDLCKNISFVSVEQLFVQEYMNCLTA